MLGVKKLDIGLGSVGQKVPQHGAPQRCAEPRAEHPHNALLFRFGHGLLPASKILQQEGMPWA